MATEAVRVRIGTARLSAKVRTEQESDRVGYKVCTGPPPKEEEYPYTAFLLKEEGLEFFTTNGQMTGLGGDVIVADKAGCWLLMRECLCEK